MTVTVYKSSDELAEAKREPEKPEQEQQEPKEEQQKQIRYFSGEVRPVRSRRRTGGIISVLLAQAVISALLFAAAWLAGGKADEVCAQLLRDLL